MSYKIKLNVKVKVVAQGGLEYANGSGTELIML